MNRYRLRTYVFGIEHVMTELYHIYKFDKFDDYMDCGHVYLQKYQRSTLFITDVSYAPYPSKTIMNYLRKPNITNLEDIDINFDFECEH